MMREPGWRLGWCPVLLRAMVALFRARAGEPPLLDDWKECVRLKYPTVRQVSTRELGEWLASPDRRAPELLDARTAAEYAVSHLPGARWVDPGSQAADVMATLSPDRSVVVYCSVGWRSSALAERLQRAGHTRVMNLEGSIFAWANEDRPLEASGGPATTVHPYQTTFGKLLRPERRPLRIG